MLMKIYISLHSYPLGYVSYHCRWDPFKSEEKAFTYVDVTQYDVD